MWKWVDEEISFKKGFVLADNVLLPSGADVVKDPSNFISNDKGRIYIEFSWNTRDDNLMIKELFAMILPKHQGRIQPSFEQISMRFVRVPIYDRIQADLIKNLSQL